MRVYPALALALLAALPCSGVVVKPVLHPGSGPQLLADPGLEQAEGDRLARWEGWERGYEVDRQVRHGGQASARCHNAKPDEHRGVLQEVVLNQRVPTPIVAEAWSRAEGVTGAADGDYSLYLDLEYTDGTPLWGQLRPFAVGTHDWQVRRVTVFPAKPVRKLTIYGIFRRHTGTAWFDDFRLWSPTAPTESMVFDGVAVAKAHPRAKTPVAATLRPPGGFRLRLGRDGAVLTPEGVGGFLLRDFAAGSDFRAPEGSVRRRADGSVVFQGTDRALGLRLFAEYRVQGEAVRVSGNVRDLTGRERAVSVHFTWPINALGGTWWDDQGHPRTITGGGEYSNLTTLGAGSNGKASYYPLACVRTRGEQAMALATPLDQPRLVRFGYHAGSRELYAAFDLGLSPQTRRFPSTASFTLALYRPDPGWGFRSALDSYYRLFPQCFIKRNRAEGIWMPFTDISTVEGYRDFGFRFKEGNDNVAFDEAAGVYSFVYVEPVSLWVNMPPEMERTGERALAWIRELAAGGREDCRAGFSSAVFDPEGNWVGGTVKCPWCDGAIYHLNPSPAVPRGEAGVNQWDTRWNAIEQAFQLASGQHPAWRNYDMGYALAAKEGRNGATAIRMTRAAGGRALGASQTVDLNQAAARPLAASVWVRTKGLTGEASKDCSLYVDALYMDNTPGYALLVLPVPTGTHDWAQLTGTIAPTKPIRSLVFHLLLRGEHQGTVWWDDARLMEGNRPRLAAGDFEPLPNRRSPVLDGVYMDSFEMGGRILNYRPEHLAEATIPLTFDIEGRLCLPLAFHSLEFARETAMRVHARGRMTFANGTPWDIPWGAAWLDVMGTETNWAPERRYAPDSDTLMHYRRALCYQRPYLLLLNTDYDKFRPEWVERYFARCAAWGVFPSFFSQNAADNPYWQNPALYNRDRPLFRRYIPVISKLNAAGWEPVTQALVLADESPGVRIERFGRPPGPVYLTVYNDTDRAQGARILVEAALLRQVGGLPWEVLSDQPVLWPPLTRKTPILRLELGPQEVKVIRLGKAGK